METPNQKIENRFTMRDFVALATLLYAGEHMQMLLPGHNWVISILMGVLPVLYYITIAHPSKKLMGWVLGYTAIVSLGCVFWVMQEAVVFDSRYSVEMFKAGILPLLCLMPIVAYVARTKESRKQWKFIAIFWFAGFIGFLFYVLYNLYVLS